MKYWNYVMLSVGVALLFELAGISLVADLLTYVGISTTGYALKNSLFYLAIFGGAGILAATVVGIFIGTITRSQPENFLILPFIIGGGVIFFSTFTALVTYAFANYPGWIAYITLFISGLLGTGFVIASYNEFRGRD